MENNFSIPQHLRLTGSEQSRILDRQTIEDFGIDGFTLMEIAASSAADFIRKKEKGGKSGFYICGKGNNAGDALAAARYLADQAGHKVTIWFALGESGLSADAEKNLGLLKKLSGHNQEIIFLKEFPTADLSSFDYVVDGLFGTGLKSGLRDPLLGIIHEINSSGNTIYAIDIPSGLNADSGAIHEACIKADYTLTFGTNKLGFYLNRGREHTGEVTYIELPFPRYLHQNKAVLINSALQKVLPIIKRSAKHKYENGVVHVMAGSEGLTGAAIMTAKSAWKQGAGAVILYAPHKLLPVYETVLPQVIKIGVGDKEDFCFTDRHAESILHHLKQKPGVLLAGPGIGLRDDTGECLFHVLSEHEDYAVLDADALSFWDELKKLPSEKRKKWLLTPHPGEAKKFLGGSFNDDYEKLNWAGDFVGEYNCYLLSKGNPVILTSPEKEIYITEYDTTVFSRAGFGDVLAGTIACNIGINRELIHSAISALNKGYQTYLQFTPAEAFGPEHLL